MFQFAPNLEHSESSRFSCRFTAPWPVEHSRIGQHFRDSPLMRPPLFRHGWTVPLRVFRRALRAVRPRPLTALVDCERHQPASLPAANPTPRPPSRKPALPRTPLPAAAPVRPACASDPTPAYAARFLWWPSVLRLSTTGWRRMNFLPKPRNAPGAALPRDRTLPRDFARTKCSHRSPATATQPHICQKALPPATAPAGPRKTCSRGSADRHGDA